MANGKIKGKQIEDQTLSLDKLSGSGTVTIGSASAIQITGSASGPNDVVTFKQLNGLGGAITVTDYLSGASFSGVDNIIFRGQTVTVPAGTATGVLAANGGPNAVMVWIPAPTYVDYINLGAVSMTNRLIASPTSEGSPYNIGAYSTSSTNPVTTSSTLTYNVSEFGYFDDTATFECTIYDFDDTTAIDTISFSMADLSIGTTVSSGGAIQFQLLSRDDDADRRKADIQVRFLPGSADANGGRLTNEIIFTNSEGGGAGDDSIFQTYFYDSNNTTAGINTTPTIEEINAVVQWSSGIAYYRNGSTFTFSVTDMDNLNDRSYPSGGGSFGNDANSDQLRISPQNFNIGNTSYHSTDFTGWTTLYDVQNLSIADSRTMGSGSDYPDLNSTTQNLLTNVKTYIDADVHDWNTFSAQSDDFPALIWGSSISSSNNLIDAIEGESKRLSSSNLNRTSGSWDSTSNLESDALQVAWDKLIFPRENYGVFNPVINVTNGRDYTGLAGVSKSFVIYDGNLTANNNSSSTPINGYRWYFSHFDLGSVANQGTFTMISNIVESDFGIQLGNNTNTGSGDVVILVGHDSGNPGSGTTPDKWINLTDDFTGRTATGNNFNGGTKQISWNWGVTTNFRYHWVAIGISPTATDKFVSQITINAGL